MNPLYIVSNKEKSLLLKEVKACFPDIYFNKILGNGDAEQNKPHPAPVFTALSNVNYEINKVHQRVGKQIHQAGKFQPRFASYNKKA